MYTHPRRALSVAESHTTQIAVGSQSEFDVRQQVRLQRVPLISDHPVNQVHPVNQYERDAPQILVMAHV
jgi:hypothetical protein